MEAFGIVLPPRAKNIVIVRCKPDGTGSQIAAPLFPYASNSPVYLYTVVLLTPQTLANSLTFSVPF